MTDPIDDLDRLADELEALNRPTVRAAAGGGLNVLLRLMAEREASDLLLLAGEPPALRVHGQIVRVDGPLLDGDDIEQLVLPHLVGHAQRAYREAGIADASLRVAGVGRFRVNLHRERARAAAAIRMLPRTVPRLASLDLPPGAEGLTRIAQGLVLIGGATGSGKSTTMAALIDEINRRDAKHIITIEDPIEFEHTNQRSVIQQVEVGIDAPDFPTALRSALRQAPDIIVIGEMRDAETMRIALAAGETGHVVFSTLHTTDMPSTIARLTDSFPAERQPTIRQEIAAALSAVYVQTLLPRVGGGRVPAAQLLLVGYGARQHIRKNTLQHLHQEITISRKHGSFTLEECLARLVKTGLVERSDALVRAQHGDDFEHAMR
ncbi:MAG: PilT/PilU family type 4a pilus ATPase [Acidobacteria bacterium]|nr:PilT/PilU family type 4a pilus ATPase [Acidobacteriota bacterium]